MSLLAVAACSSDSQARADTTTDSAKARALAGLSRRDSAAGYVVAAPQQGTTPKKDTTRAAKDSAALADSTRRKGDSAAVADTTKVPALTVQMAPGRPKKDSLALISALRAFNKHPGWPVQGLAP